MAWPPRGSNRRQEAPVFSKKVRPLPKRHLRIVFCSYITAPLVTPFFAVPQGVVDAQKSPVVFRPVRFRLL